MPVKKGQKMPKRKCYNIDCDDYNEEEETNCRYGEQDEVTLCMGYVSEARFKKWQGGKK